MQHSKTLSRSSLDGLIVYESRPRVRGQKVPNGRIGVGMLVYTSMIMMMVGWDWAKRPPRIPRRFHLLHGA